MQSRRLCKRSRILCISEKNIIYLHSFSSNLSLSHIDVTNVKISGLTSISQIWNVLQKQSYIIRMQNWLMKMIVTKNNLDIFE